MPEVVFANRVETLLRSRRSTAASATLHHVLMGTWLTVLAEDGAWFDVQTRTGSTRGFVHRDDISLQTPLKIFYVDVGQGDGAIIESPQGIVLIDGGPSRDYYRTVKARAAPVLAETGQPLHIDAVVVSHPDDDHYTGLVHLLRDPDFTFGRIYHNGIVRYAKAAGQDRLDLGAIKTRLLDGQPAEVLTRSCNDLHSIRRLLANGGLMARYRSFWEAAVAAEDAGRLHHGARRLTHRDRVLPRFSGDPATGLRIEVLAPVVTQNSGRVEYATFAAPERPAGASSASHTINGHSIVLKLLFGDHSFLFGGDLNIPAQRHLLRHYVNQPELFRVDVNKACHHGSSDFDVQFLKHAGPHATVFSSGEDRLHDHPLPDALGAAVRHSRGDIPLLFSTELARTPLAGGVIHRGDINARSNGRDLVLAQRREKAGKDPWHSYLVPFHGRFDERF